MDLSLKYSSPFSKGNRATEPFRTILFLVKNGAKIHSILQMLIEFKVTTKDVPDMVVIVGFIGDILEKKRDGH